MIVKINLMFSVIIALMKNALNVQEQKLKQCTLIILVHVDIVHTSIKVVVQNVIKLCVLLVKELLKKLVSLDMMENVINVKILKDNVKLVMLILV